MDIDSEDPIPQPSPLGDGMETPQPSLMAAEEEEEGEEEEASEGAGTSVEPEVGSAAEEATTVGRGPSETAARRSGLRLADRIMHVVESSPEKQGISLYALKRAVGASGYDVSRNRVRFKRALKHLVDTRVLKKVSGNGLNGSFRMGKKGLKNKKRGSDSQARPAPSASRAVELSQATRAPQAPEGPGALEQFPQTAQAPSAGPGSSDIEAPLADVSVES
ncbi:histone H1C-like [Ornithorhynchus anatinus]|uniref:histone H1C-like n=1 Tax=Ornithorhynchus anatinus TaxID=9258 RepID=UPI0010A8137F|nr:histone H1C-like [Ornithorhynchus anatinus]